MCAIYKEIPGFMPCLLESRPNKAAKEIQKMAHHTVTLNYTAGSNPQDAPDFAPDHNPIRVHAGETIAFRLGTGPPDAKLRLTFADPVLFSTADPAFHATGRF